MSQVCGRVSALGVGGGKFDTQLYQTKDVKIGAS